MKLKKIDHRIARARAREFVHRSVWLLSYAVPIWAALAALALLIVQFAPGAGLFLRWFIFALALGVVAGCAIFGALGAGAGRLAGLIDRRAGLKDRLTNAREFAAKDQRTPLMELAIADAEEAAADLEVKPLFSFWAPGNAKRLASLLLVLPLLYVAAMVNVAAWFKPAPEPDLLDTIVIPDELADDGFRDLPPSALELPAVAGLRGLIGSWRSRLADLRERARLAASAVPPEEPELPETIYREDLTRDATERERQQILAADGLPAVRQDGALHLSDLRALGNLDTDVDSSMRTAFAQLDEVFLEEDPNIQDVEEYVNLLEQASGRGHQSGSLLNMEANYGMQAASDADPQGAFRTATQGAQQESFNEFLSEYARHLGRVSGEKKKITGERAQQGAREGQQVLVSDQGQQTPPGAEMRMIQMTEEMAQQLKLNAQIGQHVEPTGDPNERTGAGQGGGTFRGAIKVKHEEMANVSERQTLQGQVGEGRAPVQILEDADADALTTYNRLYSEYREDAALLMDDAAIPVSIRSYVQRYLQSISPDQVSPDGT